MSNFAIFFAMTPETQRLIVLVVLGLLGVGMVGAAFVFVFSIWRQRKYNKTALPSLGLEQEDPDDPDDPTKSSAFALDLVKADPVPKGAFATRLDEDVDFTQFTPRDDAAEAPAPRPVVREEAALPMPPGLVMSPADDDEPDDFPPFESNSSYVSSSLQEEPRAVRDFDDDDDLDFTPVIEGKGVSSPTQEFRKLRTPAVDNIEPIVSENGTNESLDNQYVGKRRENT